jgi:TPP-dependent pyruvate/acetoin dehydrogenase alpha subunit
VIDHHLPVLGDLADPECPRYLQPLDLKTAKKDDLMRQLKMMLLIRKVEERIGDKVASGQIVCPCHLAIGQEAIAVGVTESLRKTDRVFGNHRSHAHYLALGGDVFELFSEVLGKVTGCSHGMGGSMHLTSEANGFKGSVPIVAGTVPLAIGAALAAKLDKGSSLNMGVSYFGDGASEEGSVQESLNFAAAYKLPMLFVCENNLFSSHLHIDIRQPGNSISRYAVAHGIPYELVDGNDIVAVAEATQRLTKKIRAGEGPGFLEAVTYRWRGHVGAREDIDVGLKRGDQLKLWKKRDPIQRLIDGMIAKKFLTLADVETLGTDLAKTINDAWLKSEQAPYPQTDALMDFVYAQKNS